MIARHPIEQALKDFGAALARPWLWHNLAWLDIRQKFSRSVLGPLWLTVNIVLFTGAIGWLFHGTLGGGDPAYLAFVGFGYVLWQFINQVVIESGSVFVASSEAIRNAVLPLSTQIVRLVWRNTIILAHNLVVVMAILAVLGRGSAPSWVALPALALLVPTALASATLIGVFCSRFRDMAQFVGNGMQLMFFLTPVFWNPTAVLAGRAHLVRFNPFAAYIEIVRAPLMGAMATREAVAIALVTTGLLLVAAIVAFTLARKRLVFWI